MITDKIENVVVPEDDDPKKVLMAIEKIRKTREPDLQQLAQDLHQDMTQTNWIVNVISFCHRQNDYFWYLTKSNTDLVIDNIHECIQKMQHVTNNPYGLMKMQLLAYDIGLEYRKHRVELDLN